MSTFKAGLYKARITKWGLSKTSKGNDQFVVTFMPDVLLEGKVEIPAAQFERSIFRAITEKTIDWFVQELEQLGYDRSSFDALDPNHTDAFDFLDMEITVKLEYETWEGKERERWSFALGGGREIKPLERKDISRLNATFADRLKALKASGKAPARTARPPAPSMQTPDVGGNGVPDDEIF